MFRLKNLDVLYLHPMLKDILLEVREEFGLDLITSAYRPGDDGVHGTIPLRGLDLRCRNQTVGNYVARWVNGKWQYDPKRPEKQCALCHNVGKGLHLHFQVHPNTIKRKEK